MSETKLRKLLEELHKEINKTNSIDEKGLKQLRDLDAGIRDLLERSGQGVDDSLIRQLQESIEHFQVGHPTLTLTLSELMSILSNAGI